MDHVALIEARRPWLKDRRLQAGLTGSRSTAAPDVLDRIIHAYRLASTAERDRGMVRSGPWQRIRGNQMGELVALLETGRPGPLAEYLRELPVRQAGHGFFQGKPTYDATKIDPAAERRRLLWIADSICGLAEALGVLGVVCPEGRPTIPGPPPPLEEIVDRIEAATGLPLGVPDICAGLFGLAVGDRVVHMRSVSAIYAALRIRTGLTASDGPPLAECRICEIGPGIGLVPTILGGLGAGEMLLVDLPELNAIQAFFLSQSLPTHPLVLHGEPTPVAGPSLRIIPDFEFLEGSLPPLDLVFNQDSLPEMDLATVRRYLTRIPRVARHFLSINQETRVPEGTPLAEGFLPGMLRAAPAWQCLYRMPAWVRAGYVEELFRCTAGG